MGKKCDDVIKMKTRRGNNRTHIQMSIDNNVFDQLSIRRLPGDMCLVGPTRMLYPIGLNLPGCSTNTIGNDKEENFKEGNFGGFQEILDEMKEKKGELTGELNNTAKFIMFIRDIITHKSYIDIVTDLQKYKYRASGIDPFVAYKDDKFLYIRGRIFIEEFVKKITDWEDLREELVDKKVLLPYKGGRYVKTFVGWSHYWFNLDQFGKWAREKGELSDEEIEDLLNTCSEGELGPSHETVVPYVKILKSAIKKFATKYTSEDKYCAYMNDGSDPIYYCGEVMYQSVRNFNDMIMQETLEASNSICEEVLKHLRDAHVISRTKKLINDEEHVIINKPLLKHYIDFPRKALPEAVITIKDYAILVFIEEYLKKDSYCLSIEGFLEYAEAFKERNTEKMICRFRNEQGDLVYYMCSDICKDLEESIGLFFDSSINILDTLKYLKCGNSQLTASVVTGVGHLNLNYSKIKKKIAAIKKAD